MKKSLFLFFVIFLTQLITNAQSKETKNMANSMLNSKAPVSSQKQIDSLLKLLPVTKNDTDKINIYLKAGELCEVKDNILYAEPALELTDKLLPLAKDSSERRKLLAWRWKACDILIAYYQNKEGSKTEKIAGILKTHIELCKKYNDAIGIVDGYLTRNMGLAEYYFLKGDMLQKLNSLQEGYNLTKKMNFKRGMSRFNLQLAFFYADNGDTSRAIEYIEAGEILEKEINDSTRNNRGYFLRGNFYSSLKKYDKALQNYNKAIEGYTKAGEKGALPDIYFRIGEMYRAKGEADKAIEFYEKGETISHETNNTGSLGLALVFKGDAYAMLGNYTKAIEIHKWVYDFCLKSGEADGIQMAGKHLAKDYFLTKQYDKAKKIIEVTLTNVNLRNIPIEQLEAEQLAYKIDSANGNYKGSFLHFQNYLALKNILSNDEVLKAGIKEKFNRDLEKQEAANKAAQEKKEVVYKEEKKKQQIVTYSVIAGLGLITAFAIFVLFSLRRSREANKTIAQQKTLVEHQKHLVEEKHKEITDSINYAERIQRSFLASDELLNRNLNEYFVFFKPKDVVSGDFYWASQLVNGSFAFVTADSTGHGVPGAIMSLLNITSLEKAIEHQSDPAAIFNETRRIIINRLKKDGSPEGGKDGMDCSLLVFNPVNMQLLVAAANNPVWIIRKGEIFEIKPDKMPLGKHDKDKEPFTSHVFELQKNDVIYTLTDGFPDQFGGERGKKFMSKNLKDLLLANSGLPMIEQKHLLERIFGSWIGNLEQVDDVTVIGIRV